MKKTISLLIALVLALTSLTALATDGQDNIITKEYGDVKVHSYLSGNISPVIVENDAVVIIDIPGDADTAAFKAYVDSIGKPVEAIIISHADVEHWIGVDALFPDVPLYSVAATAIKETDDGETLDITLVEDGVQEFAGVEYDFLTNSDIGAYIIKLPAQKAAYFDHLGYIGLHIILPPLEARLEMMRALQSEGYTWFMAGHGLPDEADAFMTSVEAYFADVIAAIAANDTPEEASAEILEKYPDYYSPELLNSLLPLHY